MIRQQWRSQEHLVGCAELKRTPQRTDTMQNVRRNGAVILRRIFLARFSAKRQRHLQSFEVAAREAGTSRPSSSLLSEVPLPATALLATPRVPPIVWGRCRAMTLSFRHQRGVAGKKVLRLAGGRRPSQLKLQGIER